MTEVQRLRMASADFWERRGSFEPLSVSNPVDATLPIHNQAHNSPPVTRLTDLEKKEQQ